MFPAVITEYWLRMKLINPCIRQVDDPFGLSEWGNFSQNDGEIYQIRFGFMLIGKAAFYGKVCDEKRQTNEMWSCTKGLSDAGEAGSFVLMRNLMWAWQRKSESRFNGMPQRWLAPTNNCRATENVGSGDNGDKCTGRCKQVLVLH